MTRSERRSSHKSADHLSFSRHQHANPRTRTNRTHTAHMHKQTRTPVLFRIMPSTTLLPGGPNRLFASSPATWRGCWQSAAGGQLNSEQAVNAHGCVQEEDKSTIWRAPRKTGRGWGVRSVMLATGEPSILRSTSPIFSFPQSSAGPPCVSASTTCLPARVRQRFP
jgi:hypothetical protein